MGQLVERYGLADFAGLLSESYPLSSRATIFLDSACELRDPLPSASPKIEGHAEEERRLEVGNRRSSVLFHDYRSPCLCWRHQSTHS